MNVTVLVTFFSSPLGYTAVIVIMVVPAGILCVNENVPFFAGVTTLSPVSVDTIIVASLTVLPEIEINCLEKTSSSFGESWH